MGKKNSSSLEYGVKIKCKTVRIVNFGFERKSSSRKEFFKYLSNSQIEKQKMENFFAFSNKQEYGVDGWKIYSFEEDCRRLSIPNEKWKVVENNNEFELCASYPREWVIPSSVNEQVLKGTAKFRSRGRIPLLSWYNKSNSASLTRCSQPRTGVARHRSRDDEAFVESIRNTSQSGRLIIFDARPKANAIANMATGGGAEVMSHYRNCSLYFLNIPNIHVMRESFNRLSEICWKKNDSKWLTELEGTGWLHHIHLLLKASLQIALELEKGTACVIRCSDGWDRTAQLSSLAQVLVDPFYRTIEGLQVLVEREWLRYGHKFGERYGHNQMGDKLSEQRSPIFFQFLDALFQIVSQCPTAFEYDERLLIFLSDEAQSCRFGTFLSNCVKDSQSFSLSSKTPSVWSAVFQEISFFTNPFYSPKKTTDGNNNNNTNNNNNNNNTNTLPDKGESEGEKKNEGKWKEAVFELLPISCSLKSVQVWRSYFFRYRSHVDNFHFKFWRSAIQRVRQQERQIQKLRKQVQVLCKKNSLTKDTQRRSAEGFKEGKGKMEREEEEGREEEEMEKKNMGILLRTTHHVEEVFEFDEEDEGEEDWKEGIPLSENLKESKSLRISKRENNTSEGFSTGRSNEMKSMRESRRNLLIDKRRTEGIERRTEDENESTSNKNSNNNPSPRKTNNNNNNNPSPRNNNNNNPSPRNNNTSTNNITNNTSNNSSENTNNSKNNSNLKSSSKIEN